MEINQGVEMNSRKDKTERYYSVRYPGGQTWHPRDHVTHIKLSEKESMMIDQIAGEPVILERSKKEEEDIELQSFRTGRQLNFEDGREKHLSFFGAGMARNLDHVFDCYDVTAGPSDVKREWRLEHENLVIGMLYSWFHAEHFDLAVTKLGSGYLIKPIHKYCRLEKSFLDL